ncbi:RagB/SusD family nutrient uptake outer membrane protein [Chitinophaga sp. CF418]|uniref:RagB/SusD family nutrient uptake outer membrane protein n=1 Tax=Chitinophaga sp. CF418 TaxID=1855287 RepID=UPI00091E5CA6|nr:RagB/SusD family nutrient uptake outer membrane protein [Chitinophaga sp. CF418]SHM37213.1 SusD family protein [Chitinophaga sp. CF418]
MKQRYYYLIVLLFLVATACRKSFLDVDDNTQFYRQRYVSDLETMKHFLNGIYLKYTATIGYATTQAYPELVADNLKPFSSAGAILTSQYSWTQQADIGDKQDYVGVDPSGTAMNPLWRIGYQIIRNCSFVIEDVDRYREENPGLADDLKGQAYAIRALMHFKMVNVFAQAYGFTPNASHPGIPYIKVSDALAPYQRQTVAVVYDEMINDLQRAAQLMPEERLDIRYMSQMAAKALLARVYLFKNDYSRAKEIAVEISSKVPLMSISKGYPEVLFKHVVASETETLFQLSPPGGDDPYSGFLGILLNGVTWGFMATDDIAELLNENPSDVRTKWVQGSPGQWNVTKFPRDAAPEVIPQITDLAGAYYPAEIRSSEMFLISAEASAKLGDEETARGYINELRRRANPTVELLTATGNALIDSIYKERRKELAFEGLRMYDLQRWRKNVVRNDFIFSYARDLVYPNDKAIAPIPMQDVNLMGIEQNKGY